MTPFPVFPNGPVGTDDLPVLLKDSGPMLLGTAITFLLNELFSCF